LLQQIMLLTQVLSKKDPKILSNDAEELLSGFDRKMDRKQGQKHKLAHKYYFIVTHTHRQKIQIQKLDIDKRETAYLSGTSERFINELRNINRKFILDSIGCIFLLILAWETKISKTSRGKRTG
jgi:hypothetical protein